MTLAVFCDLACFGLEPVSHRTIVISEHRARAVKAWMRWKTRTRAAKEAAVK
jgi:hypothetical protein